MRAPGSDECGQKMRLAQLDRANDVIFIAGTDGRPIRKGNYPGGADDLTLDYRTSSKTSSIFCSSFKPRTKVI